MKIIVPIAFVFAMFHMGHAAHLRNGGSHNNNNVVNEDNDIQDLDRSLEGVEIMDLDEEARKWVETYFEVPGYPNAKVEFTGLHYDEFGIAFHGLTIDPISETAQQPLSLDSVELRNNGPVQQTFEISEQKVVSNTFTSSVVTGFKSQKTIKASVSFKAIANVESSMSMERSLDETDTESATEDVTVAWTQPLVAAPFTRYTAKIFQRRYETEPKFTADIEITGRESKEGPCIMGGTRFVGKDGKLIEGSVCVMLKDLPGMDVTTATTAKFLAKGQFGSVSGRSYEVDIECFDIETNNPCGKEEWSLSEDGSEVVNVHGAFY